MSENPDSDELKQRFREAVERKHAKTAEAHANAEERDRSKVHGAQGPAGHKRTFRRKSG